MSEQPRKFNTRPKFGKKRKKSSIENFKKRPTEPERMENPQLSESDGATEAFEGEVGLAGPSAAGTAETSVDSGRVRRDTTMLQSSDLEEMKKKADEKLQELASTAATKRKSDILADAKNAADYSLDDTSFTVVSLESLNVLMRSVKCGTCGGAVQIGKSKREYGLAVKLSLTCANCGDISSAWSSPRVKGDQRINPFAVNILAARAMQSTGNQQTALNDVFSAMNISHRGLHTKTWQDYMKRKLAPALARAAQKLTTECARSVLGLYTQLNMGNPGNIAVSYDGSWMTRGHSSHIGVGTVIKLFTGFVLDYVVLSNFCAGCERGPKQDDPSYPAWRDGHVCQKNTNKKAGEMEVEAALILFQRSWERHNVRYTTVLSDGDSRSFLALQEAEVYGYIPVNKEDCVNHVKKRMGTALRNLVSKQKGSNSESLGGRGRLTGDLITKLSSYYGWALKSHKGDVEAMQKAVMATYHHVTSNDAVSNHSLCPVGPDSWCRQNAMKARGEPAPKHRHNLPPHVCKALLPLYERLSDKRLLERCQRGKTQNNNESLHSVIWALVPKHRHASLFTVRAAVAEAVMKFNAGNEITSARVLKELNVTPGPQSTKRMVEKDKRRTTASIRKRATTENVQRALKKRHAGANCQVDYVPGAY
ncbi:unnamed protein product [Ixodes persulcatus]